MGSIQLSNVQKTYPGGHRGVRDLSLQIGDGELMVLVGPSGSGKSTALRLIAGLESPDEGRVLIDGRDVTDDPPQQRDLAMVFQSYALYPHKSVRENLAFALRMRGADRRTIQARVDEVARMLQIEMLLDRKPAQLSGGQRQRVALGRALVREPRAFLLDEPLSNLDPALRLDTRAELSILHRRLRATMVYVTHDQEEAMTLGDRVAVMAAGTLQQVGPPAEIYEQPANRFVARFVGSPPMNLVPAAALPSLEGDPSGSADELVVGIRPHDLLLAPEAEADLAGEIEVVEMVGHGRHLRVRTEKAGTVVITVQADTAASPGDRVGLRIRRDRVHRFAAGSGLRVSRP